ncbi:GEVED domain-containing protein [Chryseobacterium oryctis]|uniref:Fibronectin type III domain-containing protein n=1 Tax=Chryseobacterium oryctis TaxID=2952618 RepID=A0ABT3HJW4_9FLAO|nr:fibronectin type III domain-containing protein [Chryseobacterium oryctis]MCW3160081.1 fibronectin type III domain-containing protein [Chryseobacterium oryctis]
MRKFYFLFLFFLSFWGLKAQYCTPTAGASSTTYYLKTITLSDQSSINYTASTYQSYVNNSSQVVNTSPGGVIQLNLATSSSTAKYYVYIDWNNDFDFNDAGENPIATTSYAATYTGTINVPAAQAMGSYRVRIENGYLTPTTPITACGPSNYGNFVDFTIAVGAPPTCIVPTALAASNVQANSVTLGWTASTSAPANGYEYYISTTNTPPTPTTTGVAVPTGTSVPVGSLAPSTTYYWWVRSVCSSTDKSFWAAGPSFTTLCSAITTLPWTENFDSMTTIGAAIVPNCWKQIKGTYDWNSSNTASTTYNGPRSTPNYMRIQYSNTTASQLWTPSFNLTAGTQYEFSFYYNTGGTTSSYMGFTGNVLVNTSQTATGATTLGQFITSTQGTANYTLYKVYYTPTTSGTYNFGLSVTSTGSPWYLGVDDFKLRVAPTCTDPQGLTVLNTTTTSTTIQWTVPTPAPAGGYDVYYTTSNATPAASVTPQYSGVTGPTQLISGLAPSTTYYIWVRARCSTSDIGDWTGPLSVYTNYCAPTGGTSSTSYYLKDITTTGGFTNLAYTASSYSAYVNNSATSFSALPGTSVNVSMNAGTSTYYYYLWIDWNNNMTFEPATETVYASTSYINTATTTINTAGRPSGSYRARFAASYIGTLVPCGPAAYGNFVDFTFIIRPCSTTAPTNVFVSAITHNSATVNWTASPDNLNYIVYWREVGATGWPNSSPILSPPTTNYAITTGLDPAKNYEVKVVAVCNTTEGTATSVPFSTKCDPTPPSITISNITTNSALIAWAPLAASSSYVMRYRIVGSGAAGWSANIPLPAAPVNTYTLPGLTPYTTYEVQIANICTGETTLNPWSNPKVFTTERTCELPPPGLTITNLTPTTAVVVWDPFPGATYILRYRKVGIPSWTNVPVSTNTYTITGLLELTKYEMQVVNVCNGTPGTYTPPYYFTTPTVTYCHMQSQNGTSTYISNVTVKPNSKPEMNNTSVGSTYSDYTDNPVKFIELIQGSTGNQISIEKKLLGANGDAGLAVWIDFDRSGTFDINERILAVVPNQTTPITGTFDVPADAFVSLTDYKYVVMRVALQKGGIPVNCTSFTDGEVEDYTVRISKNPVVNTINQTDIMIYPNPVSTVLNVKNISKKANYKIYNTTGQVVSSGLILNNAIDVRNLINGVYVIDIDDVQGKAQKKFIKE